MDSALIASLDAQYLASADREMAKIVYRSFELGLVVFYGGIYSNVMEITPPLRPTMWPEARQ